MEADRIKAGAATLLVQALLGYALIVGLGVPLPNMAREALTLVALPTERQLRRQEKPVPPKLRAKAPEGKAAPPNIRSRATRIVAPPPTIPFIIPPPVVAAPVIGLGNQPTQGAAPVAGPGTGAGGSGDGTGSGGHGDGGGGGAHAAMGAETPPRWIRGRLKDGDYPRGAGDAGAQGSVGVRFTVEPDGRVDQCIIRKSSGNAELDATTCRLIEQRYRYRPALDENDKPVRAYIIEEHEWDIEAETPRDR